MTNARSFTLWCCSADRPAPARRTCRSASRTKWRFGMEALPGYELTESFRLLVALFSIADTHRRTLHCAGGCSHAWHNLPDPLRDAT
ncbi:DUF5958 family protein [Streptomyces longwoodensis]|uniref:DUF5958 family protein n=1 Tax=Streptomyces longwoodensis TaxID=68231 RepID=UPI00380F9DC2